MGQKPKIAIFGGGTGLSVLLRGLKHKPVDITAIVTVADDGGSSGRLRNELQIPPPGDIRNVLAALSDVEPLVENLFQHRFNKGSDLTGHSLGNLILAAMTNITGDFFHAVTEMSKVLNVRGRVLPAANTSVILHAEMEDGQVVSGESTIPSYGQRIKRVFLTPEKIDPLPETLEVIRGADLIIIGPGSLYTSILPNLLVPKIGEEVLKASAKKVYICNVMTQPGETLNYSAADHVKALNDHMDRPFIDTILINNEDIPDEIKQKYAKELARPVDFNVDDLKTMGLEVIRDRIVTYKNDVIRHDTHKVASLLVDLLKE
ncbi:MULTISPECIES: gluconeogenesis factor YvcK family protein [Bacillus]|uniref:gluconeogenesis factor YvcK family protein n=1 Tax=Bacillus TaxID=1386 RepID=UPI0007793A21|nr:MULTISPECIES: YvcK family protein [Bacillus]MBT2625289.1 YvcK family protein [Bacillus sp. ISL-32]KAA6447538.1 YvcK family protein [Bacillus atrophaeus]MCG8398392.1 YvcK family protein [Bacillus atrophaeus]MCI3195709.1 YvcK family protein [Bacillus sp. HU-1818]MCY8513274.1 YvcK family protein [Bacillus atrophaeus]